MKKATVCGLAALIGAALLALPAQAQMYSYHRPVNTYRPGPGNPPAPDACGPGSYCTGPCGMVYGPNYCLYPQGCPFLMPMTRGFNYKGIPGPNVFPRLPSGQYAPGYKPPPGYPLPPGYCPPPAPGIPPSPGPFQAIAVFPTHPFARSPRDFFMADTSPTSFLP